MLTAHTGAFAQVGVNTEPQGPLHVDAKGDTNGTFNTTDDVIVTAAGYMGIGTLNPQERLHIKSSTPGAIRIADGTQGDSKILSSKDANGTTEWISMIGSWYASLEGGYRNDTIKSGTGNRLIFFTDSTISTVGQGSAHANTGIIKVPYTGTYRISITGKCSIGSGIPYFLAYVLVLRNNTWLYPPHIHGYGNITFGFTGFVQLNEDDEIKLHHMYDRTCFGDLYRDVVFYVEFAK